MSFAKECAPVYKVEVKEGETTFFVDTYASVRLSQMDPGASKYGCPVMSQDGKCKGQFPCHQNEGMYITVVPEGNQ